MTALTRHELLFQGRMNIRYHESLERFYGQFLNWTAFVSLLLSSAAFATLGSLFPADWQPAQTWLVAGLALSVAGLNGALLAFGMLNRLMTHAELKKQWILFLGRLPATDDAHLAEAEQAFHALNAQEPAPDQRRLDRAYEETCASLGLKPYTPFNVGKISKQSPQ